MRVPGMERRSPFVPPSDGHGQLHCWLLALAAHGLLAAAVLWTVHTPPVPTVHLPLVQAEFWAPVAPPPPAVVLPPQARPNVPDLHEAEIALERKRTQERQEQERRERQQRLEQERQEQVRQEQAERERLEAQRKAAEEAAEKAALAQQAAREKAQAEQKAVEKKAAEEKRRQQELAAERRRQENIRHMQQMAGNTANAPPSQQYLAQVQALIRSKTVYPAHNTGNPRVEVRVRIAPDGRITHTVISKPSGVPAWDQAVLRALQKTATLPRDSDGRVPITDLIIVFQPHD